MKPEAKKQAEVVFANSGVHITTTGKRHLGAALGDDCFVEEYIRGKVDEWAKQVLNLTLIAKTQPHAAYSAFTHGLIGRWNFLLRTVKEISHLLAPLEKVVRQQFIPALTGQTAISDEMKSLLALPCRLGGLNVIDPTQMADWHYQTSERITAPLAAEIVNQQPSYSVDKKEIQKTKKASKSEKEAAHKSTLNKLKSDASPSLRRTIELAGEKEASSWLTVLPIQNHGFHLPKCEFRDAICLRYGLSMKGVSSKCSCGSTFNVDHAMICPKGGFPTIRHNEVRDITANLISEVCSDVAIEPRLNSLSGECLHNRTANRDEEARLDVSARGVWRRGERAFFDIRVFYPNAQSYQEMILPQIFRNHELEKQRAYGERVREVEGSSFTPLVLSSTGGMGREANTFYKRLASLISDKQDTSYSQTMALIRCRLSFSLLRSAILCVRGTRSSKRHPVHLDCVDSIVSEARLIV